MISVDIAGVRFQVRAAAVFCHAGHILLHRVVGDDFWTLPGGRVEVGEAAHEAVIREIKEELNESIECGELLYTVENFFSAANQPNHELGLYFKAYLHPDSPLLNTTKTHLGVELDQPLEYRWFAQESLPALELYPGFLRTALAQPTLSAAHIVQRG